MPSRPLTWQEYLQLQGLYSMVLQASRELDRFERAAGKVLEVAFEPRQAVATVETPFDQAVDVVREGYSYRDFDTPLDDLLRRFDVEIPDAPDEPDG